MYGRRQWPPGLCARRRSCEYAPHGITAGVQTAGELGAAEMFRVTDIGVRVNAFPRGTCFSGTALFQLVGTPFRYQHVLSVHAVVILLAISILLVLGLIAIRTLLLVIAASGHALQLLQARFDFVHQADAVVVVNHTIA